MPKMGHFRASEYVCCSLVDDVQTLYIELGEQVGHERTRRGAG